jgi:hypothetical protein
MIDTLMGMVDAVKPVINSPQALGLLWVLGVMWLMVCLLCLAYLCDWWLSEEDWTR